MSRSAVSFAVIAAAEADIARVAGEIRRRLAELDRDLAGVTECLTVDEIERIQAARTRRDAAMADLAAVFEQLGTAMGAARDAGLPTAYARPGWS